MDYSRSFLTKNHEANGRVVHLSSSLNQILANHKYPVTISKVIAELLIINVLLGQNLKSEGIVTCQIQTGNPLFRLAVSEYIFGGKVRAYASFDENSEINQGDIDDILSKGHMIVTYESGQEKYQGIIELKAANLSESFNEYLKQSEQIDSEIKIFTEISDSFVKSSAILLKKLPSNIDISDQWNKFSLYIKSVTKDELLNLSSEELLTRLFHEDGVIIYDKNPIIFSCRCSREKMENAIFSIPESERESLKIDGKLSIKCQFCSKEEFF
jgi:molecular chaperone Hsp33